LIVRLVKVTAFLGLWAFFFAAEGLTHIAVSLFRLPGRWKRIGRITRRFARLLNALLGFRVRIAGEVQALASQGAFIASNHVSYADGFVLSSLFPVGFVTKKEVRGWPIVGQWMAVCRALFIDRQRKGKFPALVVEVAERLRHGADILIFFEGTSTNGEEVLPFQSAPFAAPLRTGAPIIPVTLTYTAINGERVTSANRDLVYWYGDMEFLGHFWKLFGVRSVEVTAMIHPKIDASAYRNDSAGRKELAQACYEQLSGRADIP
jgi:lyso-ornithine lipid O-acyltransferase